ncbi:MAG: response regulator, partial [Proteobacteria bacterium]|nr:response regulator [Pseudomonadota bacterium]
MKILIVDDEISICQRLQRELQKEGHEAGYQTLSVHVLEELRKASREGKPFDLLLLNITMPEMDGLTLLRRIREERLDIGVIIMTGHRKEQTVIEAIRLSAVDYLNKPISLEELDDSVFRMREKIITEANNNKYRILVVDDEKKLCRRIKRELDKEGYRVTVTYSGEECLDYFKKNSVDVLIADIKMPQMNGLEMLKKCREINSGFAAIIITGHGDHEIAKKSLKLGAYDYLKKPISLFRLILMIIRGKPLKTLAQ